MVGTALALGSLIGGAISGAGSIAQGIMGSNAAHSAANTQSAAAAQAAQLAQTGAASANQGIAGATTAANTNIGNAITGMGTLNATNQAMLQPYISAGTASLGQIMAGLQPGGQFSKKFTAADMEAYDPGYQFRLQQGQQAIERSAAARGTQLSGGTLKDLTDYEQGTASSEYQNAFNRYMAQNQQAYSQLAGVTNLGYNATGAGIQGNQWLGGAQLQGAEQQGTNMMQGAFGQGANTMTAAQIAAQMAQASGNAQAAGTVGGNNALWQGIGGAINTGGKTLAQLLNPATAAPSAVATAPAVIAPQNQTQYGATVNPYNYNAFLGPLMAQPALPNP